MGAPHRHSERSRGSPGAQRDPSGHRRPRWIMRRTKRREIPRQARNDERGATMRVLVQRVSRARVVIAGETVGEIDRGLLLLVGLTHDDTESEATFMAAKVANLRIFDDAEGNLNLSAL